VLIHDSEACRMAALFDMLDMHQSELWAVLRLRCRCRFGSHVSELHGESYSSGGEARSSSALREHIDQLTREAFELRRGLTQQVWPPVLCGHNSGGMIAPTSWHWIYCSSRRFAGSY
jgi:hypothetical protein